MELLSVGSSGLHKSESIKAKHVQQEKTPEEKGGTAGKQLSKEELQKSINVLNEMNESIKSDHTSTRFVLHEKLNDYYVQIVDDATNEVMKEIPSKKFLDLYAAIIERAGIFVDKKI